jgi:predicted TPR repeat methyltransferase
MQTDDRFERGRLEFLEGLRCQREGDLEQAESRYKASLLLVPARASTLSNLAAAQIGLGRPDDALRHAQAALDVAPGDVDALRHRATALAMLGRHAPSVQAWRELLAIESDDAAAWSGLGHALRESGQWHDAAEAFERALVCGADADTHRYFLAAVRSGSGKPADPPSRPPRAYVEGLFDSYAREFDAHLVHALNYQAHRQLVDGWRRFAAFDVKPDGASLAVLDLGCGTGLCAGLVAPWAARLVGVDVSAAMVERARDGGLYQRLEHADLVEFLQRCDERFDLVLAADVLIYVGSLAPVFASARRVMRDGSDGSRPAVLAFSVEAAEDDEIVDTDGGHVLRPSLRYAHSSAAIERLAAWHGWVVLQMHRAPLREDAGRRVDGLYVYLGAAR